MGENRITLKQELYGRLGQHISELFRYHELLHTHVYGSQPTFTNLSQYEIFQRIAYVVEDVKFTSLFLKKLLEEDNENKNN